MIRFYIALSEAYYIKELNYFSKLENVKRAFVNHELKAFSYSRYKHRSITANYLTLDFEKTQDLEDFYLLTQNIEQWLKNMKFRSSYIVYIEELDKGENK